MGIGECEGDSSSDRMLKAVKMAANADILNTSIAGATGIIFSIQTGYDLTNGELEDANNYISSLISKDVTYIFGHSFDKNMNNKVVVTLIATGCKADNLPPQQQQPVQGQMQGQMRPNFSNIAQQQIRPRIFDNAQQGANPSGMQPQAPRPQQMPNQQPMQQPVQPRIDSVPKQQENNPEPPSFMKRLFGKRNG